MFGFDHRAVRNENVVFYRAPHRQLRQCSVSSAPQIPCDQLIHKDGQISELFANVAGCDSKPREGLLCIELRSFQFHVDHCDFVHAARHPIQALRDSIQAFRGSLQVRFNPLESRFSLFFRRHEYE